MCDRGRRLMGDDNRVMASAIIVGYMWAMLRLALRGRAALNS